MQVASILEIMVKLTPSEIAQSYISMVMNLVLIFYYLFWVSVEEIKHLKHFYLNSLNLFYF